MLDPVLPLLCKDFPLRIVTTLFCLISFLPLLSFQSVYEYAAIFSSPHAFELSRISGILQYYLHLSSTLMYHVLKLGACVFTKVPRNVLLLKD